MHTKTTINATTAAAIREHGEKGVFVYIVLPLV